MSLDPEPENAPVRELPPPAGPFHRELMERMTREMREDAALYSETEKKPIDGASSFVMATGDKSSVIMLLEDKGKPIERLARLSDQEMINIVENVRAELNREIDVARGTRHPLKKESELMTVGEGRVLIAAYECRVDQTVKEAMERFNQVAASFAEAMGKMGDRFMEADARAKALQVALQNLTCEHYALQVDLDALEKRTWRARWFRFTEWCASFFTRRVEVAEISIEDFAFGGTESGRFQTAEPNVSEVPREETLLGKPITLPATMTAHEMKLALDNKRFPDGVIIRVHDRGATCERCANGHHLIRTLPGQFQPDIEEIGLPPSKHLQVEAHEKGDGHYAQASDGANGYYGSYSVWEKCPRFTLVYSFQELVNDLAARKGGELVALEIVQ